MQQVLSMHDDLIHILIRRPDHGTHKLFPQEARMMGCITLAAKSCTGENCVKWKRGAINLGSPPVNGVKLHPTSSCGMLPMQKRHHTCEGREVKCLCHEVNKMSRGNAPAKCTGSSKKNPAKFGDTCSVRADGLCIGCLGQYAERGRENSNMQEFFRTTLYYYCARRDLR